MEKKITKTLSSSRPPIVAVLGHVDHGKTSLLDYIRKTSVTSGEAGGITQKIGAYQIMVSSENEPLSRANKMSRGIPNKKQENVLDETRKITFIDTPGHEAFAKMRLRGSQVADIALLIVAANDGVMPQTKESIQHIKNAKIPFIVVINKIDLPDADVDKIKQQLAKEDVLVEGFGGDVVVAEVSAKTGKGIPELLDLILLIGQMNELKGSITDPFSAVVIESKMDKKSGVLASVIVKSGILKVSDVIFAGDIKAKVRAMISDKGEHIGQALPSQPIEILGWEKIPEVGILVTKLSKTKEVSTAVLTTNYELSLPAIETAKKLKIILKADVSGSLEAIKNALDENAEIVASGTGEISESDVLLAKSTGSVIIGFNLNINQSVARLAMLEGVKIKTFKIIYELLDQLNEVIQILNQPQAAEEIIGEAQILAEFRAGNEKVAGCKVLSGRVARGDRIKIMRLKEEIGKTKIKSIRHGKDDIPKAEVGTECGILFDKKLDFRINDRVISYKMHELLS